MDENVHYSFLGVNSAALNHHQSHSKISDSNLASLMSDSEMDEIHSEPEKDNFGVGSGSSSISAAATASVASTLEPLQLQHESYGSQRSSRIFMTPSPPHSQSMFSSRDYNDLPPLPPPPPPPLSSSSSSALLVSQPADIALLKTELKLFAHERDLAARKEMMQNKSESRRLNMSSSTGDPKMQSSLAAFTKHGSGASFDKDVSSVGGSDKALSSTRDYDRLRAQCESAMRELQSLRRQHSETMRKCEMAMKESEFYRVQHKQALAKLDLQQGEALALRTQCNEVLADKHRLEHEVADLQKFREEDRKEVAELRRQQQEAMNESGNSEAINQMYITAVRKYEAIKDDYDSLRKRYADLIASHSSAASKLELNQEEVARLKKQLEDVVQERNGAVRERNGLKQQCTAAIRQWDSALRERNEAKESLAKVQQQRDEAMKEINQAMAVRIKATKDLARLNEERNAAVQEYTLIMSERDSVHKEIEKLHEELGERNTIVKALEAQKKAGLEEVETLRREIVSALHDRDKSLKHCHDLREKYGDYDDGGVSDGMDRDEGLLKDYDYYGRGGDPKLRNSTAVTVTSFADHHPQLSIGDGGGHVGSGGQKAQKKERMDNLDQANQEIDRLRKQSEKLQTELGEALQESEVSKRRRDWAFSERDKIVQERESIRTLCDKLRRERDRAVSDLAEALRDSDNIKKQRNEASKELKEMRERIEAQLEKESRLKQLNSIGHNHSRDSAIDTDLQEWETETLEFEIGAINEDELGFELAGGKDDPQFPDSPIYVSIVLKGSAADGKLRVNDCVLRVNNVDLTMAERRTAIDTVRNCGGTFNMIVRRRRLTSSRFIQSVHLNIAGGKEHGLQLETGVYVSRISPGSVAAKEGNLALGDRVINVNGRFLEGMWSGVEAMKLLDSVGDSLVLSLLKCVHLPNGGPLSSSSSGHNLQDNGDATEKSISPKSSYTVSSSPSKDFNVNNINRNNNERSKEASKKLTTSSSQTDSALMTSSPDRNFAKKRDSDKTSLASPSHHTFLDKIFGDRRSSKDRNNSSSSSNKQQQQSSNSPWTSPSAVSPVLQEEEVIAELDSVIEHFKKNSSSGKSSGKKRTKREKEHEKNNGGTWPKYRGPPLEYAHTETQCPGTMSRTRRRKERISISSLLNASVKLPSSLYDPAKNKQMLMEHGGGDPSSSGRSSRRTSTSVGQQTVGFGVYGVIGGPTSLPLPPPPPPQSSSSSVSSTSPQHLKSSGLFLSSVGGKPFRTSSSTDEKSNRSPVHYSAGSSFEFPLDYSVVSANRDKEVLEYYKNKNKVRPKSAMYLQSDSFLSSDGSLLGVKPSSLDIQSMVGHLTRSHQLSPTDPLNLSPRLSERNQHHQRAPSQPTYGSLSMGHQPTSSLIHGIGMPAYYTVCGGGGSGGVGRIPHDHHQIHHPVHGSPSPRYCSPPTLPYMSRSGESLLGCSSIPEASLMQDTRIYANRSGIHPSPSQSPSPFGYTHSPSHSMELPHFHHGVPTSTAHKRGSVVQSTSVTHSHPVATYRTGSNSSNGVGDSLGFGSYDGPSTIPKRSHYRIRIPSNQSVTSKSSAGKVSTGSIERAFIIPDRSSPMPAFHVETITPNGTIVQRSISDFQMKKPSPGELRNIRINKNTEETLGIQIDCGPRGGIFVSSVSENSLAAQAGIHIGDQLLEVCGINMRSATYLLAANVLRQCGDSVTMLVQYNPEKYRESLAGGDDSNSSSSSGGNGGDDDDDDDDSPMNTPTPRSSPKDSRNNNNGPAQMMEMRDDGLPASATSTLKRKNTLVAAKKTSNEEPVMMMSGEDMYEPRFVFLKTVTSSLGITFLGGNAVGIFVHKVQPDSPASGPSGLRCGDQILEYNGIDLRQATAEQAAYELAKRADTITILAQYDIDRYTEVQHLPGDSLFVRALFDHAADGANELSFRKDDILYVDNTMFNGVNGLWRAWIVDDGGHKKQCGVIPSKYKVEEDLLLRRSLGELDPESGGGSSRRGSAAASARRSFFRRYRKQHHAGNDSQQQNQRSGGSGGGSGGGGGGSNSRDSKELASFSDVSINSCSGESGTMAEIDPPISTYQRVERLDADLVVRPVLVVGPLIDVVVDKLVADLPHKFARCVPEVVNASVQAMEKGLEEGVYVDFRRRGSHFEVITLASVREICEKACHCIMEVNPAAAERLHRVHVYPIVLFVKFKSTKQIREVKDPRSVNSEKVTTKAAKEMYDHSMRLEQEYKHIISATIPGGNLSYMCSQIKTQVDQEQSKTLWVPAGSI